MASAGLYLGHRWPGFAGHGLSRRVRRTLHAPPVVGIERVYLMTTKSAGFYRQLGFQDAEPQQLMVLRR